VYFLGNIYAENCENRFMCVRVIARQSSDILGHSVVVGLLPTILVVQAMRSVRCVCARTISFERNDV